MKQFRYSNEHLYLSETCELHEYLLLFSESSYIKHSQWESETGN